MHDLGWRKFRITGNRDHSINRFAEVMRSHVGCHTNRDTLRTIDQKVREAARQDFRFDFGAVIVSHEIDGFAVDIANKFKRELVHSGFGITHSRSFIAIDITEVTMAINKRVTQREWLG